MVKKSSTDIENGATAKSGLLSRISISSSSKRSSTDIQNTERIHAAVWPKFNMELFQVLLEQFPEELNRHHGILKDSLLHRAVRHGKIEVVKYLLDKPVKIDAKNAYGHTPLHVACQLQKLDIARLLADAGADVNLGDLSGDAPIHLACKVLVCKY